MDPLAHNTNVFLLARRCFAIKRSPGSEVCTLIIRTPVILHNIDKANLFSAERYLPILLYILGS